MYKTFHELITKIVEDNEPIKEPAKIWRNKYEVIENCFVITYDEPWGVGTTFFTKATYPSKEIAEQKHLDWTYRDSPQNDIGRIGYAKYLGAFPWTT